jgi:hypothetical protein
MEVTGRGFRQQWNVLHMENRKNSKIIHDDICLPYYLLFILRGWYTVQYQLAMSSLRMTLLQLEQSKEEPERREA